MLQQVRYDGNDLRCNTCATNVIEAKLNLLTKTLNVKAK